MIILEKTINNLFSLLNKIILQKKIQCIICIIVLMESFVVERVLFHIDEIRGGGVKLGLYILAKVGIAYITFFVCNVIVKCKSSWNNHRVKVFVISFFLIMSIYMVYMILGWPGLWLGDNHMIFCKALRFEVFPEQSAITTLIYVISLMLIPHPISIVLFQLFIAALVGAYVISYCYTLCSTKKILCLVLLFVSFPAVYYLMQTMRNAIYGYLLLFLEIRFIEIFQKNNIDSIDLVRLARIVGILSALRGEGKVILVFFVFTMLLFIMKLGVYKIIVSISSAIIIFSCFNFMDSNAWESRTMGGERYSYSLTPFITGLSNILKNMDEENNEYIVDIKNIDKVISIKDIKEHASDLGPFGYEVNGIKSDFSNDEYYTCLMSICRLIFYNMDLYLDSKLHLMINSVGLGNVPGWIPGQFADEQHLSMLQMYGEERLLILFEPINEKISTQFYDIMRGYYSLIPYTFQAYYFIWALWVPLIMFVVHLIFFMIKRNYIILLGNLYILIEFILMFMLCSAEGAYYYSIFYLPGWISLFFIGNSSRIQNKICNIRL